MTRLTALLLTALTGFSGLVYEITWQKYLATLLGSHSEATAAVLGLFLGGLALGYALFGALTRRVVASARAAGRAPRLLLLYGAVEASIGVYALAFPLLFRAVQSLSCVIGHGSGGLGFALDVVLCALLIGPPAVLMGATIPMLTQALARSLADATRFHALVYAFNTAGAFAGALGAGFWLVPKLGLVRVLVAMGLVNLAAGAVFAVLGWRDAGAPALPEDARGPAAAQSGSASARGLAVLAGVALLVGFATMTLQTTLIRLGALSLGSSEFTFSTVVSVFVLCIALGSFAVSALSRIPAGLLATALWALFALLYLLYGQLENAPYWAHALRSLFVSLPSAFHPFHLAALLGLLAVIGLPVALSGATLPLLFHHLRREHAGLGDVAGRLYGWNTLGSLLGALGGGYALLIWLNLHQVYAVALAALAVAAALVTVQILRVQALLGAALLLVPALGAVALLPRWSPERLASGLFRLPEATELSFAGPEIFFAERELDLLFYDDDPTASVAVREDEISPGRGDRSILINGKSDSSVIGDRVTTGLLALLPAVLAERTQRAFVVGYGTGVTAGELAALDSVKEVVVAEISPGVVAAAPLFEEANLHASTRPNLRIEQSDAYRSLLRSEGRFDVIVSEPSNPWVTGVEMLYSREFLEAARDRLAPGGAFAQWLHLYETDAPTVSLILRTYAAVFDHVSVWYSRQTDLILIGMEDLQSALDLQRVARRFARSDFTEGFARCGIGSLPALLAHELVPLGVLHAAGLRGAPHTLLRPRLAHHAARAFFLHSSATLPFTGTLEGARRGERNSLVRRYLAGLGPSASPAAESARSQVVQETCEHRPYECLALLAEWIHEVPESAEREQLLEAMAQQRIPLDPSVTDVREVLMSAAVLSRLFGAREQAAPPGSPDAFQEAQQQAVNFVTFYSHAAPFSRPVLDVLWQRCEADPAQRELCRAGRERWETALGSLRD